MLLLRFPSPVPCHPPTLIVNSHHLYTLIEIRRKKGNSAPLFQVLNPNRLFKRGLAMLWAFGFNFNVNPAGSNPFQVRLTPLPESDKPFLAFVFATECAHVPTPYLHAR